MFMKNIPPGFGLTGGVGLGLASSCGSFNRALTVGLGDNGGGRIGNPCLTAMGD